MTLSFNILTFGAFAGEADFIEGVIKGPDGEVEYMEARCHACNLAYDRAVIEQRLVQMLGSECLSVHSC